MPELPAEGEYLALKWGTSRQRCELIEKADRGGFLQRPWSCSLKNKQKGSFWEAQNERELLLALSF